MSLRNKAIIFFDAMLLAVCVILVVMGFRSAGHGFELALEDKADGDLQQTEEILSLAYPGAWEIRNGALYKGETKLDGEFGIVDRLASLSGNNVTIFRGDERVSTTFVQDGKRLVGTKASEKVIEAVLKNGERYVGEAEVLGDKYFCAYDPIRDSQGNTIGMMFMGIPKDKVELLQRDFLVSTGGVTLLLVLLVGVVVLLVLRKIMIPLQNAVSAMERIADGDLSGGALAVGSGDEIGQLADAANRMKASIVEMLRDIATSAEQLAAASEELSASTSQTSETIRKVSDNIVSIATGTEQQATDMGQMNDKSEAVGMSMASLQVSAQSMQEVAEESQGFAKTGHETVSNAIGAMQKMSAQMESSLEVVDGLGKQSKDIAGIVETISGIAEQTNLLALNAAIEAARAGEAGRGFAVVADEVRKLAEQSALAAKNITGIITRIQQDTRQAMEAMERGNVEVQNGTGMVRRTGEVFSHIEQQIDALCEEIKKSIECIEQADSECLGMVEKIQSASASCRTMAEEARSVSSATEEQNSMMGNVAEASESLADLAQKLQNEVAKFRF